MEAKLLIMHILMISLLALPVHYGWNVTKEQIEPHSVNLSEPLGLKTEASFEMLPTETDPPVVELFLEDILTPPPLEMSNEAIPVGLDNKTERVLEDRPILIHQVDVVEELPMPIHRPRLMTPLDQVGNQETSLVDKIIMVDTEVCGDECGGTYPNTYRPSRWRMCHVCHCDTMCQVFRDCCPSVLLKYNITYDDTPRSMDCVAKRAVIYDSEKLNYDDFQAMVVRCPSIETVMSDVVAEDQTKCERPDLQDREQSMPVSSSLTGLTYRNIYCARCHNDDQRLDQWQTSVTCAESAGALISIIRSKVDLYRTLVNQSLVNSTKCELEYNSPSPTDLDRTKTRDGTYNRLCNKISTPLIDTCNATGVSRYHDPNIESACAMYESAFDGKYRNLFCYICNLEYPYSLQHLISIVHFGYPANAARVSFAALLDLSGQDTWAGRTDGTSEDDQCNATQVFDVLTCKCRELECSEGKYLDSNGTCHSLMETDMLGYRACHRLDIVSNTSITEDSLHKFIYETSMVVYGGDVTEQICHVLEYCPNGLNASLYFEMLVHKFGTLESLESIINNTLESHLSMVDYVWQSGVSSSISTVSQCLAETNEAGQCPPEASFSIASFKVVGPIMQGTRRDIYYINYTQTSNCAFVNLEESNLIVEDDGKKLTFEPTGEELSVNFASTMGSSATGAGNIRVCTSEYKKLSKTSSCYDDFDTWTISGLVSIISTSISLLCLALTFAVYLFMAPLRSGGGKNIMVLAVLLFVAQALYEFGIEQYENRDFCRAVGIAVHYFWLAAVFSMNACTVERFLKLCYPLKTRSFFLSERRPFMMATSYSLLCAMIIVGINISVNLASRGDLGYGSPSLCYINSRTSRIAAFAVPLGIVVLSNLVLLGVTVWTLRRQSGNSGDVNEGNFPRNGLQSTKSNKVGLIGCVRLSVVTGITWLLVFLYEAIPSEALSYLITALVGLQGLIFFLSMVFNKRIYHMLEKHVKSSTISHTSSSGSHSSKNNSHKKYHAKETVTDKISDSTINVIS